MIWKRLLIALALLSPSALAQGNAVVLTNTGAPTGGCAFVMFYVNKSDNTLYDCNSGTWHLVGPGAAGSATWNSLADPTGNQALSMAHFTSTWTYDATTGTNVNTFVVRDTTNNTGTGHIFLVNTASGSAAKPIGFFAGGTSNGVEMSTAGVLAKAGTGAINANQFNANTVIAAADGGNGIANTGAAGKVPIGDGSGHFVEGDPLVQGTQAAGSTTLPNPVVIGGSDYGGTATVRTAKVDSNGIVQTHETGTATVSGTVTTTPPANASTNVAQLAGTTTDTNSGTKSAGTLRVVLATDQPALTNKLLVTPDSVALPANQSVNVSQINGVTPLMGNGTTGTGSQRVTIASDNTAFSVNSTDAATSATAAAVPAKAGYIGGAGSGSTGGNLTGIPVGDTYKNINVSTATTTLLVTGVSGRQVRISALHMVTAAANNVALIEGTGATCGTGTAGLAGGTTAASGYNLAANGGIAFGSGVGTVMQTATTGDSVCVVTSAATQLSGGLQYTIY